ncbi:MAG TPA: M23 family metallopeptidase [Frankiaceae bacterium]|nr:M23 family metallopeptidase [Frankiaceae bacterium]
MRRRSLFVRRAPRSTGILGPLAVALALAVVGAQLDENATRPAVPASAGTVAAAAPARGLGVADFPERVVRGTTVPSSALAPAPKAAPAARRAPARASRSTRPARPAAPRKAWVRSCRGPLTSYYGMRWGKMHKGLDFGCSYGSPIVAASSGTVTFAGPQGGYGRLVLIRHDGGWITAYGHMSRMIVRVGQKVTAGQVIAYVGSAGHSTGPHLHFEVRTGGGWINPLPFLRARGVLV